MAKLPKWAIKQAGGINKKAWALARAKKGKPRTKAKPKGRKKTMAKKKSYRRTAKKLLTKPFIDGLIASGGKVALKKFGIQHQLLDAGIDGAVGVFRNNKTLQAQAIVEGLTTFLPSLNGGANGSIGGWEE